MLAKRVCASLAAFMIAAGAIIVPLGEGFHSAILPQPMIVEAVQSTKQQITKADIVFVVDSTGSMSRYIKSVKSNLTDFVNALNQRGVELNLSVVEFKDIEVSGNESTVYHTFDGSHWTSDTTKVIDVLDSISHNLGGGGDDPETPLESFDKLFTSDDSKWYEDDNDKFIFLLTDAGYKESSSHTFDEWADIISGYGIKTTVVSRNSYKGTYRNLYENTGGQFLNIDSNDYSSLMLDYADWVEANLNPLAISVYGDYTATYSAFESFPDKPIWHNISISAYVKNINDASKDVSNAYVKIILPDGFHLTDGDDIATSNVLAYDSVLEKEWTISIDSDIQQGSEYTIKIICGADNTEEKTVVRTIKVPEITGFLPKDNRIDWGTKDWLGNWSGVDNLAFINAYSGDKAGFNKDNHGDWLHHDYLLPDYYLSSDYYQELTNGMSNTVFSNITKEMFSDSGWGGSCYGMSAVVSLMKAGYLTPSYWQDNASVAHDLHKPKDDENIENLINFYHLSQYLPDIKDSWNNAYTIAVSKGDFSLINKSLIDEAKKVKYGGLPVSLSFAWSYTTNKGEEGRSLKVL